jgi:uncharacterized protein (DUF2236 family)
MLRRGWLGPVVFMAGAANVVLQMTNLPVARGIAESTVESGSVYKHPIKRFRTTVGYLDVALFGDDQLRADFRHAINGAHRQIRSTPSSPVKYNAFNRHLQLWVASCLYYGTHDIFTRMYGALTDQQAEDLLQATARLGTTLQVPVDMWHRDRQAFQSYWDEGMQQMHFDDVTRAYVLDLINVDFLPPRLKALKLLAGAPIRFFNVGFLPPEVRQELGLEWSDRQDKVFNRALRTLGIITYPLPFAIRRVPSNWMSMNLRIRRRLGLPMI